VREKFQVFSRAFFKSTLLYEFVSDLGANKSPHECEKILNFSFAIFDKKSLLKCSSDREKENNNCMYVMFY
jgi:hypothetical protein